MIPYETPVIIENIFSSDTCESLCDVIATTLGSAPVQVQRKRKQKQKQPSQPEMQNSDNTNNEVMLDIYDCTLDQAFDLMMQSNHYDSIFAFCEGLLDTPIPCNDEDDDCEDYYYEDEEDLGRAKEIIYGTIEELFQKTTSPQKDTMVNQEDWFPHFPNSIRPTDCIVIAGEGATSTLHRDPFEWTGLSLCLEGTKVWRFVPPPIADMATTTKSTAASESDLEVELDTSSLFPNNEMDQNMDASRVDLIDDFLNAYRLTSVAWGDIDDENENDTNENKNKNKSVPLSAGWQSDKSLFALRKDGIKSAMSLADVDESAKNDYISSIAKDPNALKSNIYDNSIVNEEEREEKKHDSLGMAIWTTVQKPGDLLVIPAYWWHQTYAFEPSLAIASQRCGSERDVARIMNHMLDVSGVGSASVAWNDKIENVSGVENREEYMSSFLDYIVDNSISK